MSEKMEVLFGRSFIYPDVIVVEEVFCVGFIKDNEGDIISTEYNSDAESWMARSDMSCSILSVRKESFEVLAKKYIDFIKASWDDNCSGEDVERLKEDFLLTVEENK